MKLVKITYNVGDLCGAVINNLDEKSTVMDDDLEQASKQEGRQQL